MTEYIEAIQRLAEQFGRLSGVGRKTAIRMAFSVLDLDAEAATEFANAIIEAKQKVHECPICGNLSENNENCELCDSEERDHKTICVVHGPKDVFAFEKMKEYHGVYHVLNGYISPSKGKGYDDINLHTLIKRIDDNLPA